MGKQSVFFLPVQAEMNLPVSIGQSRRSPIRTRLYDLAFDTSNELEKNVFLSLNNGEAFHDVMKAANGLGGGSELYPYPLDTSTEELRSTMWSPQFWTTKKVKKEQFKLLMPAFMKTLARANGMEPTASGASSPYKICTKTEKAKLTRMNCVEGEHWWLEIGHPDQATNKVSWKIYTEPIVSLVKLKLLLL